MINFQIFLAVSAALFLLTSLATYKFLRRKRHCMELLERIDGYIEAEKVYTQQYEGVLLNDKNGFDVLLLHSDDCITHVMREKKEWEPHLQNVLKQLIKPKDKALVLGGHFGIHTLLISKLVGTEGKVSVFEANPNTLRFLRANLAFNNAQNTALYPYAVFSKNTELSFVALKSKNTGSSHIKRTEDIEDKDLVTVRAFAIDSLPEFNSIDILQMDIEGAEPDAVYGAAKLIDNSPNLIAFQEWTPNWISDKDTYLKFWRSRGYKIGSITAISITEMSDEELKQSEQLDIIIAKNLGRIIESFKPLPV